MGLQKSIEIGGYTYNYFKITQYADDLQNKALRVSLQLWKNKSYKDAQGKSQLGFTLEWGINGSYPEYPIKREEFAERDIDQQLYDAVKAYPFTKYPHLNFLKEGEFINIPTDGSKDSI